MKDWKKKSLLLVGRLLLVAGLLVSGCLLKKFRVFDRGVARITG